MATQQILTFHLANELYAVDILRVQEIKAPDEFTPIPNSEPYMCGVMNLRGAVVPVFDLRKKFGFDDAITDQTVVIILNVTIDDKAKVVGIVVDAVSDTHEIELDEKQDVPVVGQAVDSSFIHGLYSVNESMVILLDADQVVKF